MKKLKIIQRTALFIVLIFIMFYIHHIIKLCSFSIQDVYEINWNIELGDDANLVYDIHTPISFHGDGERFTIFEVQKNKINLKDFYRGIEHEAFAEEILDILDVSEDNKPDFDKDYIWKWETKQSNKLLMVYCNENNYLYLFQHLQ